MDAIEKRARELLDTELRKLGLHEDAYHVGCGAGLDRNDQAAINAIAAALTPQWQPIESAPKTTRSILVWCPERQNQYMVYWDGRYEGEWRTVGGGTVLAESPTKWHPLPAPPEAG